MRRRSLYRTTRSRCLTRRNDGLRSMPVRSSTEIAASGENAATDSIFLSRVRRSSSQQIAPYPVLAIALRVPVVPHDSERRQVRSCLTFSGTFAQHYDPVLDPHRASR